MLYHTHYCSPIANLILLASDTHLKALLWESEEPGRTRQNLAKSTQADHHPILKRAKEQLDAYFVGELQQFDLPLEPEGTAFQKTVWSALTRIPYGQTRSYSALASLIKAPKASRAVGMANHRNPFSIIVPCHRVIGKNGTLTGYAGGLEIKTKLLELERKFA